MADTPRKTLSLPVKATGDNPSSSARRKPLRTGGPQDKRKVVAPPAPAQPAPATAKPWTARPTAAKPPLCAMTRFTAAASASSSTPTATMLCESCATDEASAPSRNPKPRMKPTAAGALGS